MRRTGERPVCPRTSLPISPEQKGLYFTVMKYLVRSNAMCLSALLSIVVGSTSLPASAPVAASGQGQQELLALQLLQSQVQTQQLELQHLQKQIEGLQKQLQEDRPTWKERYPPVIVSGVAALFSYIFFWKNRGLNRQIADRTVTIEAQKLLVEINKQYIAHPPLFAIYDDYQGREGLLATDPTLTEKIKALGYLKLNIFELVYSVMPNPGVVKPVF